MAGLVAISLVPHAAVAQICAVQSSFSQPVPSGVKTVLYDRDVVVFQASFRVDTDGNIRSYSAVDPTATRCGTAAYRDKDPFVSGCGMDSLCNGLVMYGPGQGSQRPRYTDKSCPALLTAFARYRAADYRLTDGTAVAGGAIARHAQGPRQGQPCETKEGFLVSQASTRSGLRGGSCVQEEYLDSVVPYVAVPKCWSSNYRAQSRKTAAECLSEVPQASVIDVQPGDLVAVQDAQGHLPVRFAIVGDLAPNRKLGEASIGLHMALKGRTELPRTVRETNAYDDKVPYNVVIFRNTARANQTYTPSSFPDIAREAEQVFSRWHAEGATAEQALRACGTRAMR